MPGMTLLMVVIAGSVNAGLLGLLFGWAVRQFPVPPTHLIGLMQGAGAGVILGHILWAMGPRKSERTARWPRLALSFVLADLVVIPLFVVAAWAFVALDIDKIWLALLGLNIIATLTFAFLSLAIASRLLGDRPGNGTDQRRQDSTLSGGIAR